MTILNLNGPSGRESRSKKTVRAWMGVGLVIAVLGIGSTFAANIGINNNNQSEFGQGVSQTVYCGAQGEGDNERDSYGDRGSKITVTPISAFKNSSRSEGRSAVPSTWIAPTSSSSSFQRVSSSSYTSSATSNYVSDLTGATSSIRGYWVASRNSSTFSSSGNSQSNYVFVPQIRVGSDYGYNKYSNWVDGSWTVAVEAVAESRTSSKFYLAGIALSDIPENCEGRDFVISGYGTESSSPLNLIPSLESVDDITVQWDGSGTPVFSFDRTELNTTGASGKVEVTQSRDGLKILFTSPTDRQFSNVLGNIVVETQDDLIGNNDDRND
jgi:hypothetical protein